LSAAARCHAVRRLNPYAGVVQIVETDAGRALSTDGANWEIQLLADRPAGWGSLNRDRVRQQHFRYAAWSAEEGLARFPLPPALERRALETSAARLLDALRERRPPFPLEDRFERWLLDAGSGEPVALLSSVARRELIPPRGSAEWHATSPGVAAQPPFEAVESLVRTRAGRPAQARWFERGSDGGGICIDPGGGTADAALPASAFPELPLAERWTRPADYALVADYLAALAPLLLMLPMSAATRARLEAAAEARPALVERFHALYPAVIDAQRMNRLRVQARLMRA
jgi:hypothetical protein